MKSYLTFCDLTNCQPIPVTDQSLCRYAVYLATKLSYNSIPKYLNIVRILHREVGLKNPLQDNWFLNLVLKGIKRDKGSAVKRKLPITPRMLLEIRKLLKLQEPRDLLFWSAITVAFFGLLRKANLVPHTARLYQPHQHLSRGDITRHRDGIAINIKWSKTIQFHERTHQIPLPCLGSHPLCPVTPLLMLMSQSPQVPPGGPLFSYVTPQGLYLLTQSHLSTRLCECLVKLGYDSTLYSGHSLRRGGCNLGF